MVNLEKEPKILVLGVGNILLRDEGVGVYVVKELERKDLPSNVKVVDGGTAGFDLIYLIKGFDKVIIVDAIDAKDAPGAVFKFRYEDIEDAAKERGFSLHEVGVVEALELARTLEEIPDDIVFFGIQPKIIEAGMELSPELKKKIPDIIELILEEIRG